MKAEYQNIHQAIVFCTVLGLCILLPSLWEDYEPLQAITMEEIAALHLSTNEF